MTQRPNTQSPLEMVVLTDEQLRARKKRNTAIGIALALFALVFLFGTMARMATKPAGEPTSVQNSFNAGQVNREVIT